MPLTESSTAGAEHMKWRRPRTQFNQPISETDPATSPLQSTRCKSTISSLLLSSFTTSTTNNNEALPTSLTIKKKTNFPSSSFRGLGCAASASQQVSVPEEIRNSADWKGKKVKKKKEKKSAAAKGSASNEKNEYRDVGDGGPTIGINSATCVDFQDVWCGPGIGFSPETAGSVDCVVARRNVSGRGKIYGDNNKMSSHMSSHRERPCFARRNVSPETISFLDSEPDFVSSRPESEVFGSRCFRHVRHPSPEGLAEIMLFQSSLMMGGRMDRFRDWRLDVDSMSYEQLLELGERIGNVSTGLKEDEINHCLRKIKLPTSSDATSHSSAKVESKCIICQEEYEADDEMGKLHCGHNFHLQCVKQWLTQKNTCPFCKVEAISRC
ncbi:hypothetical protein ACFX13_040130 [Malus domestica]|uniref:RING-type E3 ubiquitin transferase n=1 Tax=Malus domestica TaxID=3750 RepID=A0A498JNI4_MALDO|nr:uncharacterized protein LOC103438030 [Malus domestica]XP_050149974.1 uncharacterized protein LOC126624957 [Malus sylvestris]RXH96586.1 hypothetical protein DVH24_009090 [Malus domestica]